MKIFRKLKVEIEKLLIHFMILFLWSVSVWINHNLVMWLLFTDVEKIFAQIWDIIYMIGAVINIFIYWYKQIKVTIEKN